MYSARASRGGHMTGKHRGRRGTEMGGSRRSDAHVVPSSKAELAAKRSQIAPRFVAPWS